MPDYSSGLVFLQTTILTLICLLETFLKPPEAKSGQGKRNPKGPSFHFTLFLLFQGNLQNRTCLKGPLFGFFSALCDIFRKKKIWRFFFKSVCSQLGKNWFPTNLIEHERNLWACFFPKKSLRFLRLRFSADFRRSSCCLLKRLGSYDRQVYLIL